jgi:hypothetical protein
VAVLAPPPLSPHGTYPQFGSRGEEQGGTCWPSTAAPPRDAKTQGISRRKPVDAVLAPAHGADASARETGIQLVRRLSPPRPPPPEGERIQRFKP